jgi:hypothetical protein
MTSHTIKSPNAIFTDFNAILSIKKNQNKDSIWQSVRGLYRTIPSLLNYSDRHRQGGQKEEKPRPDTRKTVTKTERQEPEVGGQRDWR